MFIRVLGHKPGDALTALYWHALRRRVRARNRLLRAGAQLPFLYEVWMRQEERAEEKRGQVKSITAGWPHQPTFEIILHGQSSDSEAERRSAESVRQQAYPHWTMSEVSTADFAARLEQVSADFVVPLRVGNELSQLALFRFAEAVQTGSDARILFGDQDAIDERGRRTSPWFKPRWNEELFYAQDYISEACAIDSGLASGIRASDIESLVVHATHRAPDSIVHVPHIIAHVRSAATTSTSRKDAIQQTIGIGPVVIERQNGALQVQWPLPRPLPLVTIIIPTRDRIDLLGPCIDSILEKTTYSNFEILVVDNQSVEAATAALFARLEQDPRISVLAYPKPYNYSAVNNFAVQHSGGDFICFLNNDTEVVEPDWLTELVRYAARPQVGAAGAKLLYDDGSIQHAGVVIGIGTAAGHAHRFLAPGLSGYFNMPHLPQYVSAVTAACMVVARHKFQATGGFDEERFAIAFNDVDLCLKLQSAGWRNVYVPSAVLIHHESKSRGKDLSAKHIQRYSRELAALQERWATKGYDDPLHNPNLDKSSETYVIRV